MRKTFQKKNIELIFGKVNEGDEIKKTFDLFDKKIMEAKKNSWKNVFYLMK